MKKLLTLLLTLVMAVCLINLNNNHTKADGENETTTYEYKYDGSAWTWTQEPGANIAEGNKIKLVNNSATNDVTLHLIDGSTEIIAKSGGIKEISVVYNVTTADIITSPANNITVLDGISVTNGVIYGSGGTWKDGAGSPINPSDYGIVMNGNTAKLTKNLYNDYTKTHRKAAVQITSDLNIVLGGDISILCVGSGRPFQINPYVNVSIDGSENGSVHKLILKTDDEEALTVGSYAMGQNLSLNNIKLICECDAFNQGALKIPTVNLGSNCEIKLTNKDISTSPLKPGYALRVSGNITGADNYNFLGKAELTDVGLKEATRKYDGTNYLGEYYVDVSGTPKLAKYIEITPKQKEPEHKFECEGTTCKTTITDDEIIDQTAHCVATGLDFASLVFDGTTKVEKIESGSTPILVKGTQYDLSDGSVNVTLKKDYLKSLGVGTHRFKATLKTGEIYYFDIIVSIEKANDPSPVVKDESCEKVIGPTWHWNESKGICEDYGVVGTFTR